MGEFVDESKRHGWLSFRQEEVVWEHVRVLAGSEVVSTGGTHLGHNLPDESGLRLCINLCSIAGLPLDPAAEGSDAAEGSASHSASSRRRAAWP